MYTHLAMSDARTGRQQPRTPGWSGLLTSTLLVGSVPAVLWLVEHPVASVVVLGAVGILGAAAVVNLRTGGLREQSHGLASLAPVRTGVQQAGRAGRRAIRRR